MANTKNSSNTAVKESKEVQHPSMYKVIVLNDMSTPSSLVVYVLINVFRLDPDQATGVMNTAHESGSALVGLYPKEIAESLASQATEMAASQGYKDLKFKIEKE